MVYWKEFHNTDSPPLSVLFPTFAKHNKVENDYVIDFPEYGTLDNVSIHDNPKFELTKEIQVPNVLEIKQTRLV